VRVVGRGPIPHGSEHRPGRTRRLGGAAGVEGVDGRVDGAEQLVAAGVVEPGLAHEPAEDLEIEVEVPHVVVAHRQLGAVQAVEQALAGGGRIAEVRRAVGGGHHRVGRGLDEHVDRTVAVRQQVDRDRLVHRVDPPDRPSASGAVEEPL
jgi:hypothetical protein